MFELSKIKAIVSSLIFFMMPTLIGIAYASDDLRVNLIATIDDVPAMEHVKWTVYRSGTESAVKQAVNHSTHVELPAGRYRAVATLISDSKTVIRHMDFYLRTGDSRIVVRMD